MADDNPIAHANAAAPGGPVNIGGNLIVVKNADIRAAASGTFTSVEGRVITVYNGIVVNIS